MQLARTFPFQSLLVASVLMVTSLSVTAVEKALYLRVAKEFRENAIAQYKTHGQLPRLTDPQVRKQIDMLSNQERFLSSVELSTSNLADWMEVCAASNEVVMSYVLLDVQKHVPPDNTSLSTDERNRYVRDVMKKNVLEYQDELRQMQPFLLQCAARQIPLMNQFIERQAPAQLTNMRRAGFTRTRAQLFTTYYGFLQMLQHDEAGEPYRRALLRALSKTAKAFASAFRPLDRRKITEEVNGLSGKLPAELTPLLTPILTAAARPTCTGLCQY